MQESLNVPIQPPEPNKNTSDDAEAYGVKILKQVGK